MTRFRNNSDRLLEVTLQNEKILAIAGSMVAYTGAIKFEKSILGGEGIFGALKRKVTNEGMQLMQTSGTGTVFFAQNAAEITVIALSGEKMIIESSSLLAYDTSLKTGTSFAGLRGAVSGQGLFSTTVEGQGNIAVISRGNLIMLEVTPSTPLRVDPDAFVGYKGNITQEFVFDVNWRTMVGETSGESYQHKFSGQGVVFIQPAER
ncbi:AIM24 family protein [Massilia scottii]|uniref:AIM24 family protein n=1 Tax=Massilia scottii TaxID=3057166 RepID=UPI002796A80D|nr:MULTISPECIES: AIM24 family protein [unclassified Massilia]MDQ1816051.1 AIM24 family protein [Massilia sp. CCM 9210]MDQ1832369.1 AIM24 family protein [Massilia sp. CCM 9029]